jgi:hydrogenase nickel incorporation protein HypA/HybF
MLMHEMMIAQSLLAQITDAAGQHDAKPMSVKISCGKLNEVNDEILRFAFESIAEGTVCSGVKLEIEHKSLQARCKKCNQDFIVEFANPVCSKCGSRDFELLPDAPLMLESIEFQSE